MTTIQITRLRPDAIVPSYQTSGSVGADLYAIEGAILIPGVVTAVGTGLAMAIPAGYEGQIRPRSGLAAKHSISVINSPGTIDQDYRGEVKVLLLNQGVENYVISRGDRVAQILISPVEIATFEETDSLDSTERGYGGFGSTGSK